MQSKRSRLVAFALSGAVIFSGCDWFKPKPPIDDGNTTVIVTPVIPPSEPDPQPEPNPEPQPQPEPNPQPEPEPELRNDLIASINFALPYFVKNSFNYTGKLQNASDTLPLSFSNSGLELILMKKTPQGNKEMNRTSLDKEFFIKLLDYGWIELEHSGEVMKIKVSNVEIDYEGKHYKILSPLTYTKSFPMKSYKFSETGTYYENAKVDYNFDGNDYSVDIKSKDFTVSE
jgi:hypothetical protein